MTRLMQQAVRRYAQYLAAGVTSLALIAGSVFAQEETAPIPPGFIGM